MSPKCPCCTWSNKCVLENFSIVASLLFELVRSSSFRNSKFLNVGLNEVEFVDSCSSWISSFFVCNATCLGCFQLNPNGGGNEILNRFGPLAAQSNCACKSAQTPESLLTPLWRPVRSFTLHECCSSASFTTHIPDLARKEVRIFNLQLSSVQRTSKCFLLLRQTFCREESPRLKNKA
jgi:hypothetical protein